MAEILDELDTFDCSAVELQWIIDHIKGKARAWAKKEIEALDRRRPPIPEPCAHMREIFDDHKDLNVAEMIEELNSYEFNPAELQWIVDNKKGKVSTWAKKERKTHQTD